MNYRVKLLLLFTQYIYTTHTPHCCACEDSYCRNLDVTPNSNPTSILHLSITILKEILSIGEDLGLYACPVVTQTGPLVSSYFYGTAHLAATIAACTTANNRSVNILHH